MRLGARARASFACKQVNECRAHTIRHQHRAPTVPPALAITPARCWPGAAMAWREEGGSAAIGARVAVVVAPRWESARCRWEASMLGLRVRGLWEERGQAPVTQCHTGRVSRNPAHGSANACSSLGKLKLMALHTPSHEAHLCRAAWPVPGGAKNAEVYGQVISQPLAGSEATRFIQSAKKKAPMLWSCGSEVDET